MKTWKDIKEEIEALGGNDTTPIQIEIASLHSNPTISTAQVKRNNYGELRESTDKDAVRVITIA